MKLEPIFREPDTEELGARIERLRAQMAEEKLDWYVSFQHDNIRYLIDFAFTPHERPFVLLIPARGSLRFVAPKLDLFHIRKLSRGDIEFVDYFEFPAPDGSAWFDRVRSIIGTAARVGVESVCPLQVYEAIPAARVRTDIIDELRTVKSPYEVGRMVHAGRLVSAGMKDLLANAQVGRTLTDVAASFQNLMSSLIKSENPAMAHAMSSGGAWFQSPAYTHEPHNFSDTAMAMEEGGPHVSIINATLAGYGSEIERTFFIGRVPEAAKRPYEVMLRGRQLAVEMAKPGVVMNDVDKAVHAFFRKEGYGEENLFHRTGHGMGITGHEAPFLAQGDFHVLEPGMSFSVEPGIYIDGIGGFRHSDTIMVTETGAVLLTDAPDSLEAMTLQPA